MFTIQYWGLSGKQEGTEELFTGCTGESLCVHRQGTVMGKSGERVPALPECEPYIKSHTWERALVELCAREPSET